MLCGDTDEPKNRFWAERAGASAYVSKHRTGELVRALARSVGEAGQQDDFFFQLSGGTGEVRDRIARYLDEALFDSVIAAEVRALATCGSFERLFDLFVQFLSQVVHYRWVAMTVDSPASFGVHHHPSLRDVAEQEARAVLRPADSAHEQRIEDEDAFACPSPCEPIVCSIPFGTTNIGAIAISPRSAEEGRSAEKLVSLIARELAGPVRITSLMEESQRLASTDALTGLSNRRAFTAAMRQEILRCARHGYPLSIAVLDVDHFKHINDRRGHASGDAVLAELGGLLRSAVLRRTDLAARWGGEEFVVAYLSTPEDGALLAAERLRKAVEDLSIRDGIGHAIPVTVSIGVASLLPGESLEGIIARADQAMYAAKSGGRNRVMPHEPEPAESGPAPKPDAVQTRQSAGASGRWT